MLEIEVAGEQLHLLEQKAVYWPREQTLLVADIHFGKAAAFHAQGVPVPQGTTTENLARLDALVDMHAAREIVFLGDFLHAPQSHAPATLTALRRWRSHHRHLKLTLVRGNHDTRAGAPPADLDVEAVDEPCMRGPFALCHQPQDHVDGYVIAGHLHPAFRLSGRADDTVRVPCFWFGAKTGVLPAFGSFTGAHVIEPASGDRIFLATPEQIYPAPLA